MLLNQWLSSVRLSSVKQNTAGHGTFVYTRCELLRHILLEDLV